MKRVAIAVLVGSIAAAHADPGPDPVGAPVPGYETGRVDPPDPPASPGIAFARGALWIPKAAFIVVTAPVKGAIYVDDRYKVREHYYNIFYNRDRTAGLAPAATWTTGLGLTIGARLFDRNMFGSAEYGAIEATGGLQGRVGLLGDIDTGTRLGLYRLEATGNFYRNPEEPFYGFGNDSPDDVIHFKYTETRGAGILHYDMTPVLHLAILGSFAQLKFSNSPNGPQIENEFTRATIIGLGESTKHAYGEADLIWDTRHRASIWDPALVNSEGSLARVFFGASYQLEDSSFVHYGGELQHFINLGYGPRVLMGRAHLEAVSGELTQVPITELPYLGGGLFLRGYPYARYRDRIAMVGTLQYMWGILPYTHAYVFTDVGRVYRDWGDLTASGMRCGFGIGLEIYTSRAMTGGTFMDLAIGSSVNGGVTVMAEFTPVFDARRRWR